MGEFEIAGANTAENAIKDFSVDATETDAQNTWCNANWQQQLGYYKKIPELKASIDALATWTVGKGFSADPQTTFVCDSIKGWGKDTFNSILENLIRTAKISGDSYAEIIRDEKLKLINLKILDPGSMTIIANKNGLIESYEQHSKIKGNKPTKFKKENIFHLCNNRVADEIHGVSIIDAVEEIVLMRNEAMADQRLIMHRYAVPQVIWHLDTDDTDKIASFKAKQDAALADRENIYIPKGAVEREVAAVSGNGTLSLIPWIETLTNYFFQVTGVPDIILGGSKAFTEASAKIAYLAFQQTIEEEQLYVEEQLGMQLGLEIYLEFPASLENEALSDKPKVEDRGIEQEEPIQPNDTTAEMEGRQ